MHHIIKPGYTARVLVLYYETHNNEIHILDEHDIKKSNTLILLIRHSCSNH